MKQPKKMAKKSKPKKAQSKSVVICSSAAFYKQVTEVRDQLKKMGFKVIVPLNVRKMERAGDFNVELYKTWFTDPKAYKQKTFLMRDHFYKIEEGDVVLVLNYQKNGKPGYIGGNVLMEMGIALHFHKPIYILNPIDESVSYKEEILGMSPIFLDGDIAQIVKKIA